MQQVRNHTGNSSYIMLHFSYTFSRCLCQHKQNPKCLSHGGIQYLHACYLNGSTRTSDTVPFGQEKPDLLGLMFLLGRKSQPYLDRCSFWAEKARPNWTNASKPDLLGPMLPLGRKSQTYLDQCSLWAGKASHTCRKSQPYLDQYSLWAGKASHTWTSIPFGQEKPAILGPVFPLGRKSQTYLDQCSLRAEKARLTWTNVPFVQEKPDQPGPMFPLGRKSQTKLDQ